MAIQFHPQRGTILICDFTGMREPEMVKRRPVVVISPRLRNRGNLVAIVPLSTTHPGDTYPYHFRLQIEPPLPAPYADQVCWVKGDMVYTVGFYRLFLPQLGKDASGKRISDIRVLDSGVMSKIAACVLHGLGLDALTESL